MADAIATVYECKHLQTYDRYKELLISINSCTAADTLTLSTATTYKATKAVVDAETATNYDAELDISNIVAADVRQMFGINQADGVNVPLTMTGAVIKIGAGPSSDVVELRITYKSY